MQIDVSKAKRKQTMKVDEVEHLVVVSNDRLFHLTKHLEDFVTISQASSGQLADYKRMAKNGSLF